MATNIKIKKNKNKLFKIQKSKDFNGNGFLHGVRHAPPYGDHFGLLWRPFWIQNGRQNTKILPIWAKFGFQVDFVLANWYPSSFWNWEPLMILQIISFLVIIILLLSFFLPSKVCPTHFSEMPWSNFMKSCRNIICHVKLSL